MERTCIVCGVIFESSRADARFDNAACKKKYQRNPDKYVGISNNVVIDTIEDTPYRFKTPNTRTRSGYNEDDDGKVIIRTGKAWYDVPLAAIPVIEKGHPKAPEWMNGREYFLWKLNGYKMEGGTPLLKNPIPVYKSFKYEMGGDGSRRWGA